MTFNPEVQDVQNGPWSKKFRDRVTDVRAKSGLTFQQLGNAMGFSGAFVSNLLGGKFNMGSQHCDKVLRGLRPLEIQANISATDGAKIVNLPPKIDLEYHIKAIKEAGGTVTF